MLVGIISDTHGSLPAEVARAFAGCGHIIHAGDVGGQRILDELAQIAPVTAVLGNNDLSLAGSLDVSAKLELEGASLLAAHLEIELSRLLHSVGSVPQACVCGHTHIARIWRKGGVLFVNPGSPALPRGGTAPSVALLELDGGVVRGARIVELARPA